VIEYITPQTFELYRDIGLKKGFDYVASGPLVRSSYHAADYHPVARRRRALPTGQPINGVSDK
jgi:lipoyl synthase